MSEGFKLTHDYSWEDVKMTFAVVYPSQFLGEPAVTKTRYIVGIERVTPRTESPHDPVDSIQEYNQGLITKQKRYSFTATTKERGSGFEMLMALQEADRYFDLVIAPEATLHDGSFEISTDKKLWTLVETMYVGCKVNSSSATYEIADIPRRDFDCVGLRSKYQMWDATGMKNIIFGDGNVGPSQSDFDLGLTEGTGTV